jgi:hypothetical protein
VTLEALGARLRTVLAPRALAAWAGTDRLSALALGLEHVPRGGATPAAKIFELLVAGDRVEVDPADPLIAALRDAHVIELDGKQARAHFSILPLGGSLIVCDRPELRAEREALSWPDDSSYHLAYSLPPGRRASWLDLGCGSAFGPLLRPQLATTIVGTDLYPRAVRYATLGAELSNVGHFTAAQADLDEGITFTAELISCNSPIPGDLEASRWHSGPADIVERVFAAAARRIAPGAIVVVHAKLDALLPIVSELRGERVVVSYTPGEDKGFAIAWWRPEAEERLVIRARLLTEDQPHITYDDRLAALAPP